MKKYPRLIRRENAQRFLMDCRDQINWQAVSCNQSLYKEKTVSIQSLPRLAKLFFFDLSPVLEVTSVIEPVMASSRDYGFDFDEDELARELLTPIPVTDEDPLGQFVGADEFDSLYKWFSS